MSRKLLACAFPPLVALALLGLASCRTTPPAGDAKPPADLQPTTLDYVDTDGFDAVLEASLVNGHPVIVVRTGREKPDWEGRLNAWIAAWNRGKPSRRAASGEPEPTVRAQAGVPKVSVDGDSIREFRLLVGGLLDRIDDAAQSGGAWWVEERARNRRVALLKPYSLRFHMDEDGLILMVLFHGDYASHYPRHMQQLLRSSDMTEAKWTRSLECSGCDRTKGRDGVDRLTSRGAAQ